MREQGKEGNKRRSWMRLEVSGGGGILVLGGVIIAAAWAAHRRHVNKERNKRRTAQGTGDEAEYEQYHKEKEELEVKDCSKDERFGEISAAVDDGLLEIKKVGSVPLIEEQTAVCSSDDDGTELCVCQSHTEKTEEAERAVEKIEMVVDHVEQEEGKDGGQEVGEGIVNLCNKDDGCDEVGEGAQISKNEDVQEDQIFDEMLFGHALNQVPILVEDETKQVDKEEEGEGEEQRVIDVLPKDESFVTVLMANIEVLEDVHHQREEEEEVYHKETKEAPDTESCEEELEKGDEEKEVLINNGVLNEEGESGCREEECNTEEEEEPETESYEEEIEPLVVEEIEKGGEQLQGNEAHEDKEESFSNEVVPKDEELDANVEQVEEETELTSNTEKLDSELTAHTEEVEARVIESNEEETESSDDSRVIESDETDATEELDAVWPAEVIETDETENQMKINDNSGQATMKKLVITIDKGKGKEFFYMMSHSRSMFLLVLAMALAIGFLSFHLSIFTVS